MPNLTESKSILTEKRSVFRCFFNGCDHFHRSTFSDFNHRYSKDERFRGVEKTRERESLFNEFIVEVRRKEKDERDAHREKVHFHSVSLQWVSFNLSEKKQYFKIIETVGVQC
jgi:hypothetical protein